VINNAQVPVFSVCLLRYRKNSAVVKETVSLYFEFHQLVWQKQVFANRN